MSIEKLMKKELPKIPDEIQNALSKNRISSTTFYEKNDILKLEKLQKEAGYKKMEDGSYLVSMYCPMPNITSEMIEWWFWWHPQRNERYQVWFPESHFSIGFSKNKKIILNAKIFHHFRIIHSIQLRKSVGQKSH